MGDSVTMQCVLSYDINITLFMEVTMQTKDYVVASLELHLFFGRIMKEHAFFLKAGFTPAGERYSAKADFSKMNLKSYSTVRYLSVMD